MSFSIDYHSDIMKTRKFRDCFVIRSNLSRFVASILIIHSVGHHCPSGLRFQKLPKNKIMIRIHDHTFHLALQQKNSSSCQVESS
ncbi:hypothetical protein L2E82_12167 [Cichorium intybus]|uniref:Uncharacterized protein n=1 Tax=Cichorium intybus TaxID=13427 RepID=A0ACB9GFC0_CICIN|nr:hypothetical protein L2E82_12167 [Cichorium intybus]